MKISSSQMLAFFAALGIIFLFVFGTERDFRMPVETVNEYGQMMVRNKKANKIKKSIISTLESIAYKEWAIDSLVLIYFNNNYYESQDTCCL